MNEGSKLAGLDVLRGLAILLVIIAHFTPGHWPYAQAINVTAANLGVILFFFLSGFLMDWNLARDGRILPFAVRRSFRILPLYWFSITLVAFTTTGWTISGVAVNATFIAPITGTERMLGVYWTLYIEVLFYAVVPFVRWAGERAIAASVFVVIALFSGLWALRGGVNAALFYVLFCFAGMQIGAWYRGQLNPLVLASALTAVALSSSVFPMIGPYFWLAPVVCALLLMAVLLHPLRSGIMSWFGRVSYSWYLLHTTVGWQAYLIVSMAGWGPLYGALAATVTSLAISALTFVVVERPGIAAGRVIARWLDQRQNIAGRSWINMGAAQFSRFFLFGALVGAPTVVLAFLALAALAGQP
jgi:peptidoglycan/LPS O-acetylase OafA/YrhL